MEFTKYNGQEAPSISGQESIAQEFNPTTGVVAIFYKLRKIHKIESVAGNVSLFFDSTKSSLRIYERFGKSYRLTWAK